MSSISPLGIGVIIQNAHNGGNKGSGAMASGPFKDLWYQALSRKLRELCLLNNVDWTIYNTDMIIILI